MVSVLMNRSWSELKTFAIGVSGKIGSGKSTLISDLCSEHDFSVAAYGAFFRQLAVKRNLPSNRETFQNITDEYLTELGHRSLATKVIELSDWDGTKNLLIDGIRHLESIVALSSIVYPVPLFTVYLDVSEETRVGRVGQRDGLDPEDMIIHDGHKSEAAVASDVKSAADLVISEAESNAAIDLIYRFLVEDR